MACNTMIGIVCAIALTGGGTYDNQMPTTAYSYDGEQRDISKFYEPENELYHVSGYAYLESDTLIEFGYDNGHSAQKYQRDPTLSVHVTQHIPLNDKLSLNVTAGTRFGGNVSETPCYDSFDREYYCGNLTAWSDYERDENESYYLGRVSMSYRF